MLGSPGAGGGDCSTGSLPRTHWVTFPDLCIIRFRTVALLQNGQRKTRSCSCPQCGPIVNKPIFPYQFLFQIFFGKWGSRFMDLSTQCRAQGNLVHTCRFAIQLPCQDSSRPEFSVYHKAIPGSRKDYKLRPPRNTPTRPGTRSDPPASASWTTTAQHDCYS